MAGEWASTSERVPVGTQLRRRQGHLILALMGMRLPCVMPRVVLVSCKMYV